MRVQTENSIYKSKIDSWLAWVLVLTTVVCVVSAYFVATAVDESALFRIAYIGILLASAAWMIWSLLGTNYEVAEDVLIARCGPLKSRVAYCDIQEISPTRNYVSSFACSSDRLQIQYIGLKGAMFVSPRDCAGFLQAVAFMDDGLEVHGDVVRRVFV